MQHTFLTDEANEMIAAVQDLKKAQERVFCAISNYYGEDSKMTAKACDWCADCEEKLQPLFGALLLAEMGWKNAVKAK